MVSELERSNRVLLARTRITGDLMGTHVSVGGESSEGSWAVVEELKLLWSENR